MRFRPRLSFKQKLLWIILASVVLALVLVTAGLLTADVIQYRRSLPRDLKILARIVADNARAPLAFSDPAFARDTLLASLSAHPRITQAVIYDEQGDVFASYARPDIRAASPPPLLPDGHAFRRGSLDVFQTVVSNDERLGAVLIQSDLQDFRDRLSTFILISAGIMILALTSAGVMALWLQRFIARPVESLAATARDVVARSDYSVRATRFAADEMGMLTDAFNSMLAHIQSQAAELADSQEKLEAIVNSINGIVWECDARDLRFTYVSTQSESLLGYAPEAWTSHESFWPTTLHPDDAAQAIASCRQYVAAGKPYQYDYRMVAADGRVLWIRESGTVSVGHEGHPLVRGIFLDITEKKRAEAELEELKKRLAESHRLAGMAEVATGVLHNVGNVLNTVNLSVGEIRDRLSQNRIGHLRQAVALLNSQNGNLSEFLRSDPRGKALPGFLLKVTEHFERENQTLQREASKLAEDIDHMKEIVATQQSHARVLGVLERTLPSELVEGAIKLIRDTFFKHGVEIVKKLPELPPTLADRHKVVQILVNLLNNAKDAIKEAASADRRVMVQAMLEDGNFVAIAVTDRGAGISPDNLRRIFQHGFTTKASGHGFGLHASALAAGQMGGTLNVSSDGVGRGATFTLRLPLADRKQPR